MVEHLINDFVNYIYGQISDDDLDLVEKKLRMALNGYEVTEKSTEIVLRDNLLPECYKSFMVSKKIEGKSENTLKLYKLYLEDALISIGVPVEQITSNHIKVYLFKIQ